MGLFTPKGSDGARAKIATVPAERAARTIRNKRGDTHHDREQAIGLFLHGTKSGDTGDTKRP